MGGLGALGDPLARWTPHRRTWRQKRLRSRLWPFEALSGGAVRLERSWAGGYFLPLRLIPASEGPQIIG